MATTPRKQAEVPATKPEPEPQAETKPEPKIVVKEVVRLVHDHAALTLEEQAQRRNLE